MTDMSPDIFMEPYPTLVTPALAAEWLGLNVNNVPLRAYVWERYARDMAAGRWRKNGDTVSFDEDGNLLDGQHRLKAVIESGVAIWVWVVRQVPRDAFMTKNSGRHTRPSDFLHLDGVAYPKVASAAAGWVFTYASGAAHSGKLTQSEIVELVRNHPIIEDISAKVGCRKLPLPYGPFVAVLVLSNKSHEHLDLCAEDFAGRVSSGEDLRRGDPAFALREYFVSRRNSAIPRDVGFAAIVRAVNAERQNNRLTWIKALPAKVSMETLPLVGFNRSRWQDVPWRGRLDEAEVVGSRAQRRVVMGWESRTKRTADARAEEPA